jgi:hypothetical protein
VNVVALSGGVGGARFLRGLVEVVEPSRLTIVARAGSIVRTSVPSTQGWAMVMPMTNSAGTPMIQAQTWRRKRWRRRWIKSPAATTTARPDSNSTVPVPATTEGMS